MSPRIKDSSLQSILATADLVDVVSGYTSLRKRGVNYSGLCPFHQEKTPSFSINADKGLYYCFGCGEGGDVVRFLERMENLSFSEAVEQLGERFGVPVEYEEGMGSDPGRRDKEARLLLLLERAATFYERCLWESQNGKTAREYLASRGLKEEICKTFRVGLSLPEWRGLHQRASKEGFTNKELEETGLLICQRNNIYDRFRGRLMFPLVDHRGRVLGFGGRTLKDESPKYLNSPEGPLYHKGHLLYGLYQARRAVAEQNEVIVVEGYTDVLGLAQVGIKNVVASMGTALTDAQIGLMVRFSKNLTFMFDADRAGTEAMLRSGKLARERELRSMMAVLPANSDPAELALAGGAQAIQKILDSKTSLLMFEIKQMDVSDDKALRGVMSKAVSLEEWREGIEYIANRLHLTFDDVKLVFPYLAKVAISANQVPFQTNTNSRPNLSKHIFAKEAAVERSFLMAVVCHPSRAATLLETLTPEHFVSESGKEVYRGLRESLSQVEDGDNQKMVLAQLQDCLQTHMRDDSEAGRLFVRMAMEIDESHYSSTVLEELYLRLQEHYFMRAISEQRARLEEGQDVEACQRRLFHLQKLLQDVRVGLKNLDPEA